MHPVQTLPSILLLLSTVRLVVGWTILERQSPSPPPSPEFCNPISNSTCDLNFNSTCCVNNITAATCISVAGNGSDPAAWKVYQCSACVPLSATNSEPGCLAVKWTVVVANDDAGLVHESGVEKHGDLDRTFRLRKCSRV
jgi:hypothetical protein